MSNQYIRLCPRCEKEMVVSEVTEDYVGFSLVKTKQYICTDPQCQKRGDADLANEHEKVKQREMKKQESKQRAIENRSKAQAEKNAKK
jgi:hypothetical protein